MAVRALFFLLLIALLSTPSSASYLHIDPEEISRLAKLETDKYCALSRINTACVNQCRSSQLCGRKVFPGDKIGGDESKGSTSNTTRLLVTQILNKLRSEQAKGHAGFPPAANMRAVSYDRECEMLALCGLRTCQRLNYYVHMTLDGTILGTTGFGIVSKVRTRRRIGPQDIEKAFHGWWDSYKGPLTDRNKFENVLEMVMKQRAPGYADDFLQVIWANVTYIGCAFTERLLQNKQYYYQLVCTYKGSFVKKRNVSPYIVGPAASMCGPNITPNAEYPDLCGPIRPLGMDWFVNYFRDESFPHSSSIQLLVMNHILAATFILWLYFALIS